MTRDSRKTRRGMRIIQTPYFGAWVIIIFMLVVVVIGFVFTAGSRYYRANAANNTTIYKTNKQTQVVVGGLIYCKSLAEATALATVIARYGGNEYSSSIAYEAYWRSASCYDDEHTAILDVSQSKFSIDRSSAGPVHVFAEAIDTSIPDTTPNRRYYILMLSDVEEKIFRCPRSYRRTLVFEQFTFYCGRDA